MPNFGELKDQIWAEIRKGIQLSHHTDSFWDNVQGFVHAVDWKVGSCACPAARALSAVRTRLVSSAAAPLQYKIHVQTADSCTLCETCRSHGSGAYWRVT
jgi:hypothetical protein